MHALSKTLIYKTHSQILSTQSSSFEVVHKRSIKSISLQLSFLHAISFQKLQDKSHIDRERQRENDRWYCFA